MRPRAEKEPPKWFTWTLYAMLSGLCYLYLFFVIEPRLLYDLLVSFRYPELSAEWVFAGRIVVQPGGTVKYLSGFLTTGYYLSWLGAAVITAVAVAISLACRILVASRGSIGRELLSIVPAIAVVMMYSGYDEPMALCVAVAVALWFSVLYTKLLPSNPAARFVLFLALFSVLYCLAGGPALLFGLLAAIREIRGDKGWMLSPLYLLTGAVAVWFLGSVVSDRLVDDAYAVLLPMGSGMGALTLAVGQGLYLYILLLGITGTLWRKEKIKRTPSRHLPPGSRRPVACMTTILATLGVCCTALYLAHDKIEKQLLEVDHLAQQGKWAEVLERARAVPPDSHDLNCNHNVNKALYYTGQLTDRMFEFPQSLPALLLVHIKGQNSGPLYLKRMQLFLNLGHINTAEHLAYELLENSGDSPLLLETLARINVVKGQTETAKVFLRKMTRNPLSAARAQRILDRLEVDPQLSHDDQVQSLRSVSIADREVEAGFDFDRFFESLLERNPRNKMAVEYMLASYLLLGAVDKIAANIHRLEEVGYQRIPRYVEEALVIYLDSAGGKASLDERWMPGADALQRAKEFVRASSGYGPSQTDTAMDALAEGFGDSYYYYFVFKI